MTDSMTDKNQLCITLRIGEKDYLAPFEIPHEMDLPFSIASALLEVEKIIKDDESLQVVDTKGDFFEIPFRDDIPKTSQMLSMARSVVLMSPEEYNALMFEVESHHSATHSANTTVN